MYSGHQKCVSPVYRVLLLMRANPEAWEILRGRGSDRVSIGPQIEMHYLI